MTHTLSSQKWQKVAVQNIALVLCCLLCLSMFMVGTADIAFCEGDEAGAGGAVSAISDAFNQLVSNIYTSIRKIITPLAAVAFAFAGVQFIIGGQKGTEKARVLIVAGIVGIGLVVFAPLLAQEVASWGVNFSSGNLSQYNPLD